jgi:hypothetical protein
MSRCSTYCFGSVRAPVRGDGGGGSRRGEFAAGAVTGALDVFGFEIVNDGGAVESDGDAGAADGDVDTEPLGFVDRGGIEIDNGVEAAGLSLFFDGAVELDFVAFGEAEGGAMGGEVGVDEDAGVGVGFAFGFGFELKVAELGEAVGTGAGEEEVGAFFGGVGFDGAVDDGPGVGIDVGSPAGEIAAVEELAPGGLGGEGAGQEEEGERNVTHANSIAVVAGRYHQRSGIPTRPHAAPVSVGGPCLVRDEPVRGGADEL